MAGNPEFTREVVRLVTIQLEDRLGESHDPEREFGTADELAARMLSAVPQPGLWDATVGPVYTATHLKNALGISRQAVSERVKARSLWGLKTRDDHLVFPVSQFTGEYIVLDGLPEVLKAFRDVTVDDWTLASWLTATQPDLGGSSVINWLQTTASDKQSAVALARTTARRWSR